jgi:hypothetical protein
VNEAFAEEEASDKANGGDYFRLIADYLFQ